jgi:predicted TIM-barrel fold metal-dependent hydrolase
MVAPDPQLPASTGVSALRATVETPFEASMAEPAWSRLAGIRLRDYRPRPRLTTQQTVVEQAAYPAIDVHNHLGQWLADGDAWMTPDVAELLDTMDATGVERIVNLDGRWGSELEANLDRYDRAHPGRFATFCHLDWSLLGDNASDGADLVRQLEESHGCGARGVKIWKDLGLSVRDASGMRVLPDDPRVIAVVRRAGELGLPVLIHTADPVAFFDPVDEHNERLEELVANPQWWFGDPARYPTFSELMAALAGLVEAAPETNVIGAHVGCNAEDLAWVGELMRRCPNFHADLGGRMAELGRQPRAFTSWVEAHPDQVLFGTDAFPPERTRLRAMFRFLETDDEHWSYGGSWDEVPPQGRWAVSGAALAPNLLEKVYRGNAIRLGL